MWSIFFHLAPQRFVLTSCRQPVCFDVHAAQKHMTSSGEVASLTFPTIIVLHSVFFFNTLSALYIKNALELFRSLLQVP